MNCFGADWYGGKLAFDVFSEDKLGSTMEVKY